MHLLRFCLFFSCLISNLCFAQPAISSAIHYDLLKSVYTINQDLSYSVDTIKKVTIKQQAGIEEVQKDSLVFYPSGESVRLLEATII